MNVLKSSGIAFCIILVSLFVNAQTYASDYTITNLGTLGGADNDSYGLGLNNNGEVVGVIDTTSYTYIGYIWTPANGIQQLSTGTELDEFYANDINDNGMISGVGYNYDEDTEHAIYWQNASSQAQYVGNIPAYGGFTGDNSASVAINNNDEIVGYGDVYYNEVYPNHHALLYSGGDVENLGLLPGFDTKPIGTPLEYSNGSMATDINDSGVFVGYAEDVEWDTSSTDTYPIPIKAFVGYGENNLYALPDLTYGGSPIYSGSVALGINNNETIVGYSFAGYDNYDFKASAVVWDPETGNAIELGSPFPEDYLYFAQGINKHDLIVGQLVDWDYFEPFNGEMYDGDCGLVWQKKWNPMTATYDYIAYDIMDFVGDTGNWAIFEAVDVNDRGQIVCTAGNIETGEIRALLLTPNQYKLVELGLINALNDFKLNWDDDDIQALIDLFFNSIEGGQPLSLEIDNILWSYAEPVLPEGTIDGDVWQDGDYTYILAYEEYGFVGTPVSPTVIPEPASLLLLSLGIAFLRKKFLAR